MTIHHPTDNNSYARSAQLHLVEACSDLKLLVRGLREVGLEDKAKYLDALAGSISSIQSEIMDQLGYGRLPENKKID